MNDHSQVMAMQRAIWAKEREREEQRHLAAVPIAEKHGIDYAHASRVLAQVLQVVIGDKMKAFISEALVIGTAESINKAEQSVPPELPAISKDDLITQAMDMYGEKLDKRLSIEKMQERLAELASIAGE